VELHLLVHFGTSSRYPSARRENVDIDELPEIDCPLLRSRTNSIICRVIGRKINPAFTSVQMNVLSKRFSPASCVNSIATGHVLMLQERPWEILKKPLRYFQELSRVLMNAPVAF